MLKSGIPTNIPKKLISLNQEKKKLFYDKFTAVLPKWKCSSNRSVSLHTMNAQKKQRVYGWLLYVDCIRLTLNECAAISNGVTGMRTQGQTWSND